MRFSAIGAGLLEAVKGLTALGLSPSQGHGGLASCRTGVGGLIRLGQVGDGSVRG